MNKILVLILMLLFYCPLRVVAVDFESGYVTGVTEAVNDVDLSFLVSGKVDRVLVQEGDWVRKGQLLISLEQDLEQIDINKKKIIADNKVAIQGANARFEMMSSFYESNLELYEKSQAVSFEEVQKLKLERDLSAVKIAELEFQEKVELLEYKLAKEAVTRKSLKSPISGFIFDITLQPGEQCEAGKTIARIINPKKCFMICNVEQQIANKYKVGDVVDITFSNQVEKKAKIQYIGYDVDPASGLVKVKLAFDNNKLTIRPGVSGKVHF